MGKLTPCAGAERVVPLCPRPRGNTSSIIQSTKNWDDVFGDVFAEKTGFDHDMQKLIAVRRPTVHMRRIDGVRLVEVICVMRRLSEQLTDDGAWKLAAGADR